MNRLGALLMRLIGRDEAGEHVSPMTPLPRDPDLDAVRRQQHDIINRVAAHHLRDSLARRDQQAEAIRRETKFWERHGGPRPSGAATDG